MNLYIMDELIFVHIPLIAIDTCNIVPRPCVVWFKRTKYAGGGKPSEKDRGYNRRQHFGWMMMRTQ
jgi:hypothetical protein